jgi:pantetheine-phosphate adenylyltransferase
MEKRRAIYPGSFDPVTVGHLDIIKRALLIFEHVTVVVARNTQKESLFSLEERVDFMKRALKGVKGVSIDSHEGLTVEYAKQQKARTVIRGLRATSDFDYEFQMAVTNRKLSKQVDTIFLMPSENHFYISSRLIKEIAKLHGDISEYVPDFVAKRMREKLAAL